MFYYPSTSAARSLSEYSAGKFFMYKFVSLKIGCCACSNDDDTPFTYGALCWSYAPAWVCCCAGYIKGKKW